jgi:hypothetical protein
MTTTLSFTKTQVGVLNCLGFEVAVAGVLVGGSLDASKIIWPPWKSGQIAN